MKKNILLNAKKKLLTLGFFSGIAMTAGCAATEVKHPEEPYRYIYEYGGYLANVDKYSNIEDYYKYVVRDGEAVKLYNSYYIYLFINKETYEVGEYIFRGDIDGYLDRFTEAELYDLPTEKMIFWNESYGKIYNREYLDDLIENNYPIALTSLSDYIEGFQLKSHYSLEELRELEPQLLECFKILEDAKVKIK